MNNKKSMYSQGVENFLAALEKYAAATHKIVTEVDKSNKAIKNIIKTADDLDKRMNKFKV